MMGELEPTNPPPGWYLHPENQGLHRWWDGSAWTEHVAPMVAAPAPLQYGVYFAPVNAKSSGVAYLLFWFLGGMSAHNFYLGRVGPAIGFLVLYWTGWATVLFGIGFLFLLAAFVWLIVDAVNINHYVYEANAKLYRS